VRSKVFISGRARIGYERRLGLNRVRVEITYGRYDSSVRRRAALSLCLSYAARPTRRCKKDARKALSPAGKYRPFDSPRESDRGRDKSNSGLSPKRRKSSFHRATRRCEPSLTSGYSRTPLLAEYRERPDGARARTREYASCVSIPRERVSRVKSRYDVLRRTT